MFCIVHCRCITEGGPAPKATPCVFPFIYGGVTYMGCAGDPANDKIAERWCSTKIDAHGKHIADSDHWGFCPSTCPSHYDIQAPVVSVTPHGVTAVPAVTRKPKTIPQQPIPNVQSGKFFLATHMCYLPSPFSLWPMIPWFQ